MAVLAVTIDAARKSRVLSIGGTGTDVVLSDLGITGGYSQENGGGIRLGPGNSLQLAGVAVHNNGAGGYFAATASGGGIAVDANSRLIVTGSTIAHNRSYFGTAAHSGCGGGIYATGGSIVLLSSSKIQVNYGGGYKYGGGGGLCVANSTISVERSTISNNGAGGSTGGIQAYSSRVTISDSTISGNNSGEGHSGGGYGGGIVGSGSFTLTNTTVTGNIASDIPIRAAAAEAFGSGSAARCP